MLPSQSDFHQRSPQLVSHAGFLRSPWTGGEVVTFRGREEAEPEETAPSRKPPSVEELVREEGGTAEPSASVEGSAEPPDPPASEEEPVTLTYLIFWWRSLSFSQKGMSVGEDSVRG